MFGKRSATGPADPAPFVPAEEPAPLRQEAPADVNVGANPDRPSSPAAERLDALAARSEDTGGRSKASAAPRATAGFEQLKKAQPVTEIVREQSDYYHATKTTILNALLNTIDMSQLAQLDP